MLYKGKEERERERGECVTNKGNEKKRNEKLLLLLLPDFRRGLGLDLALDELAALGLRVELERA